MNVIRSFGIPFKAFFIIFVLGYLTISLLWADGRSIEKSVTIIRNDPLQREKLKSQNITRSQNKTYISKTSGSNSIGENYINCSTLIHFQSYFSDYINVDNNKVYTNQTAKCKYDQVTNRNKNNQK